MAAAAVAEVPWQVLSSPSALQEAQLRVGRLHNEHCRLSVVERGLYVSGWQKQCAIEKPRCWSQSSNTGVI